MKHFRVFVGLEAARAFDTAEVSGVLPAAEVSDALFVACELEVDQVGLLPVLLLLL